MTGAIVITGAGGFLGSRVSAFLEARGYHVIKANRVSNSPQQLGDWNTSTGAIKLEEKPAAVINLAGRSIVHKRWTDKEKKLLWKSRVDTTDTLAGYLKSEGWMPPVWIGASGLGIYGDHQDNPIPEDTPVNDSFLGKMAHHWERAALKHLDPAQTRFTAIRFSMILGKEGGAWPRIKFPFSLGLGGNIGNGSQFWSWVHIEDVVAMVHFILENDNVAGPVNVASPNPVRNAEFTRTVAGVLKRPAFIPLPAFAVKLIFGEMGEELFLSSQKTSVDKILAAGFTFNYPDLEPAVRSIC